jgi:hypothetical protein
VSTLSGIPSSTCSDPTKRGVLATWLLSRHTGMRLRGTDAVTHVWFNESPEAPERYPITGPDANITIRPSRPLVQLVTAKSSRSEIILTFMTTRQDLADLSLTFAGLSGRVKYCTRCGRMFIAAGTVGSLPTTCLACSDLRRSPSSRYRGVWHRLTWRLSQQVRSGRRSHEERVEILKRVWHGVQNRIDPNSLWAKWDAKTRLPRGRPRSGRLDVRKVARPEDPSASPR